MWPSNIPHYSHQSSIRANDTENGRFIRRHVQSHWLQLFSVEVKDEGYASVERSLVAGTIWGHKTGQDRCHNVGGDAHENDGVHPVLHRHEPVQQLQ